jgi:hypothetical protein
MGTTADKLQAVLSSKNAIRDKFNLGDIPFAQYAENIKTGSGAAFYLCSYVNRNYFSYNTIVVSGMPTAPFVGCTYVNEETWETANVPEDIAARDPNGTYTLQNPTEQIYNWYWQSENGCVIDHWNMGMGQPIIYPGKDYKNTNKYIYVESMMGEIPQYPVPDDYTSFEWKYSSGSGEDTVISGGSAVVPRPPEVEKYWEGYKLEADENGKYNLASNKTKLTYGDYMPVAGRIYDAAASVEITNADLTEDALWACPRNMTSDENEDWKVTCSNTLWQGQLFHMFDNNMDTVCWTNYPPNEINYIWMQWESKKKPVLVKQLIVTCDMDVHTMFSTNAFIRASNDGETWVDIASGNLEQMGTTSYDNGGETITLNLKDNLGMYKFYRLGQDRNTYMRVKEIKAYCQIPREVPK